MRTLLPPDQRSWFVYRVYDEYGLPLYIGCTMKPTARWRQHSHSHRAPWAEYAHTFKMSGPYTHDIGYRLEMEAIGAEQPFFNATRPRRRFRCGDLRRPYLAARDVAEMAWALTEADAA